MGIESLLGGFAKGFGSARMMKMQREKEKELVTLQKQQIQQQIKKTEEALLEQKRKAKFEEMLYQSPKFQKLLGISQQGEGVVEPVAEKQNFGESFKGDFAGELAAAQMDPVVATMLKQVTGMDFLGAGRLEAQQQGVNINKQGLDLRKKQFEREAQEYKVVKIPNSDGSETTVALPKFGGPGTILGSSPPTLESFNRSTPEGEFRETVNKATQQPVSSVRTGKVKGETAETASKIALATNATKHIQTLRDMFITADGSVDRQMVLLGNAPMGGIGEGRTAYATFIDALDARARAATGAAMPESEIKTYTKIYWPSALDSDKTIKDKINRLDNFMKDFLTSMDPGGEIRKRMKSTKVDKDVDMVYNPDTGKLEPVK